MCDQNRFSPKKFLILSLYYTLLYFQNESESLVSNALMIKTRFIYNHFHYFRLKRKPVLHLWPLQ